MEGEKEEKVIHNDVAKQDTRRACTGCEVQGVQKGNVSGSIRLVSLFCLFRG